MNPFPVPPAVKRYPRGLPGGPPAPMRASALFPASSIPLTPTPSIAENVLANQYTNESLRRYLERARFVGQGVAGNVFTGPVPCSMNVDRKYNSYSESFVGKLFESIEIAEKEYELHSLVERIDPMHIYIVQPLKLCTLDHLTDASLQVLFNKVSRTGNKAKAKYRRQIIYPHGGVPLHDLDIIPATDGDRFIYAALFLTAMTGYMNVYESVYHMDIKEDNILFSMINNRMSLIDFGRVASDLYDISRRYIITAFAHQKKQPTMDRMFEFYTQFSPEVMYIGNLARYISWRLADSQDSTESEPSLQEFEKLFFEKFSIALNSPLKKSKSKFDSPSSPIPISSMDKVFDNLGPRYGQKLYSVLLEAITSFKKIGRLKNLESLADEPARQVLSLSHELYKQQDTWALSYTFYKFFKSRFPQNRAANIFTDALAQSVLSQPFDNRPNLVVLHDRICARFSMNKEFLDGYNDFVGKIIQSKNNNQKTSPTNALLQEYGYVIQRQSKIY